MNTSTEYPCVYFEKDGKCQKFSDDTVISYCVMGPCPEQKLSNADRIRAMSDEELAVASVRYEGTVVNATRYGGHEHKFYGPHGEPCANKEQAILMWFNWLQQPAEEGT